MHTFPRVLLSAPPSAFPQERESAGRARWLTSARGLARYADRLAELRVVRMEISKLIHCPSQIETPPVIERPGMATPLISWYPVLLRFPSRR